MYAILKSNSRAGKLQYVFDLDEVEDFVKDENGEVVELICTYVPETKGGQSPDGR